MDYRREIDLLGTRDVPAGALWGIHTMRAVENFPLARRPVHRRLVHAYGAVKLAAARTNRELGHWDEAKVGRHRSRLPGNDRRHARRARRRRCTSGRGGHLHQYERQRGAGQPGTATPGPAAGRLPGRQPARRPEPPPIDQRHLSRPPCAWRPSSPCTIWSGS